MSAFSFLILPQKSLLAEKDRFNKHDFIKAEKGFFIYARPLNSGFIEGGIMSRGLFDLIQLLANELKLPIYFLVKELKHQQSERDFSIDCYLKSSGVIDGDHVLILNQDSPVFFEVMYQFSL